MSKKNESTIASEMIAAAIGGALSASILYPLEGLKTNIQAADASTSTKDGEVKEEEDEETKRNDSMIAFAKDMYNTHGLKVFFHGFETSAFQSSLEKAIYFFSYTALKKSYARLTGNTNLTTVANLALGYAADWSHLPVTLPVDAWTTEIQTAANGRKPLAILLCMLSDSNRSFYKGLSAYYLLCLKPALQYTVYEQVKKVWLQSKTRRTLTSAEAFALGMLARAVATLVTFPFLRAKVLLQTQQKQEPHDDQQDGPRSTPSTTASVLTNVWEKKGLGGLYQGVGPELTRGVMSAALMLMIKERVGGSVQAMLAPKKA